MQNKFEQVPPVNSKSTVIQAQPLGSDQLMILWRDGHISLLPNTLLQLNCRCAKCTDEMTGKRLIQESDIDPAARLLEVTPVGGYGLRFRWSKGCESGIYTFDLLKNLEIENLKVSTESSLK